MHPIFIPVTLPILWGLYLVIKYLVIQAGRYLNL